MANPTTLVALVVIVLGSTAYIHAQPLLSDDPITIDPIGCVTNADQQFCTSVADRANTTTGQSGGLDPDVVCPTASITDQNLTPDQVATQVSILLSCRLNFDTPQPQIATCVNAVRVNPDAFACLFPCDYNAWRDSVVWPPRQALDVSPTGVQQLTRYVQDLQESQHNTPLIRSAIAHAEDMATNDYFAHVSLNGDTLVVRVQREGFLTYPLGENIAAGFDSVRTLSLAWFW